MSSFEPSINMHLDVLGAVQPSLGSAFEGLSNGQAPERRSLIWREPVDHGAAQDFAEFMRSAGSFLSHYIVDSLGGF